MSLDTRAGIGLALVLLSLSATPASSELMPPNRARTEPACVRVGLPKVYATYDPAELVTTPQYFVINALMGRLFEMGENDEIYSSIAKTWRIRKRQTEFTIDLDPASRFSDGTPITSADVAASIKRAVLFGGTHLQASAKILGARSLRRVSDELSGIRTPGPRRIVITLSSPEPMFLYWLAFPEMGVITARQAAAPEDRIDFSITSGAFTLRRTGKGKVRLEENPHFIGKRGSASSCLDVAGYPTAESAIAGLLSGRIDVLDYGATLDPAFGRFLRDDRFSVSSEGTKALAYLLLNPRRRLFADREARRWFLAHLDRARLIPYGQGTLFRTADQFLTAQQQGRLSTAETTRIRAGMPAAPPPSVKAARKITLLYPEVFGKRYERMLVRELRRVHGWDVSVKTYAEGDLISAVEKDDYDVLFVLAGMSEKDTGVLLSYHFLKHFPLYRFSDPFITTQLERALKEPSQKARADRYRRVSRRLLEEAYIAPIAYFAWPIFHRSDIRFIRKSRFQFQTSPWCLEWRKKS